MCEAMLIPESTIRSNLKRMKKSGEIDSIVIRPLGMTGRRLLTDAEEEIIYNMIIECQE